MWYHKGRGRRASPPTSGVPHCSYCRVESLAQSDRHCAKKGAFSCDAWTLSRPGPCQKSSGTLQASGIERQRRHSSVDAINFCSLEGILKGAHIGNVCSIRLQ